MLNYRHLYYFWMVAREGGFARAAERLDMAVQTVSAQVRELERALGHQLLRPAGRTVALTDAGRALLDSARAFRRSAVTEALADFTDDETQALAALLTRLAAAWPQAPR